MVVVVVVVVFLGLPLLLLDAMMREARAFNVLGTIMESLLFCLESEGEVVRSVDESRLLLCR